jgi:hypothetical protein
MRAAGKRELPNRPNSNQMEYIMAKATKKSIGRDIDAEDLAETNLRDAASIVRLLSLVRHHDERDMNRALGAVGVMLEKAHQGLKGMQGVLNRTFEEPKPDPEPQTLSKETGNAIIAQTKKMMKPAAKPKAGAKGLSARKSNGDARASSAGFTDVAGVN